MCCRKGQSSPKNVAGGVDVGVGSAIVVRSAYGSPLMSWSTDFTACERPLDERGADELLLDETVRDRR
jgi:hypothetical protein